MKSMVIFSLILATSPVVHAEGFLNDFFGNLDESYTQQAQNFSTEKLIEQINAPAWMWTLGEKKFVIAEIKRRSSASAAEARKMTTLLLQSISQNGINNVEAGELAAETFKSSVVKKMTDENSIKYLLDVAEQAVQWQYNSDSKKRNLSDSLLATFTEALKMQTPDKSWASITLMRLLKSNLTFATLVSLNQEYTFTLEASETAQAIGDKKELGVGLSASTLITSAQLSSAINTNRLSYARKNLLVKLVSLDKEKVLNHVIARITEAKRFERSLEVDLAVLQEYGSSVQIVSLTDKIIQLIKDIAERDRVLASKLRQSLMSSSGGNGGSGGIGSSGVASLYSSDTLGFSELATGYESGQINGSNTRTALRIVVRDNSAEVLARAYQQSLIKLCTTATKKGDAETASVCANEVVAKLIDTLKKSTYAYNVTRDELTSFINSLLVASGSYYDGKSYRAECISTDHEIQFEERQAQLAALNGKTTSGLNFVYSELSSVLFSTCTPAEFEAIKPVYIANAESYLQGLVKMGEKSYKFCTNYQGERELIHSNNYDRKYLRREYFSASQLAYLARTSEILRINSKESSTMSVEHLVDSSTGAQVKKSVTTSESAIVIFDAKFKSILPVQLGLICQKTKSLPETCNTRNDGSYDCLRSTEIKMNLYSK